MKLTKLRYSSWILLLLLAVPAAVSAGDDEARAVRETYVPGEVLVKFKQGAAPRSVLAAAQGVGAKHLRSFAGIGVRHWRLGKGLSVQKALKILAKRKNVEYAEPNYIVTAHDLPDDPLRTDLWGMHNIGQSGGTADADIDAPEAWGLGTNASSVIVGVIDTGIDYEHEDLAANMWTNPGEVPGDGIDNDGNGIIDDVHGANFIGSDVPTGDPMDDNGHGSHTAGTIGAVGNNAKGVAGVCWKVQLMALKFLDAGGRGSTADALEAVQYAASFGVRVTNNSWGGGHRSKSFKDAVKASGALFVASAGNSGSSRKQYPAALALDNVIAVAATDHNDDLASFSNYGSWVHLAAPGVDTLSCIRNDKYGTKSGTSMACPHVAGAAALAIAYLGGDNALVKAALLDGVDAISGFTEVVSSGGRLNLFRTLGGVPVPEGDSTPPDAVLTLAAGAATAYTVPLTWIATGDDGLVGTTMLYDLRYATAVIGDEAAWDAAVKASGEPLPLPSGSAEAFTLAGLEPLTMYYVALRVQDEAGNMSALSNLVSATTLVAPPGAWADEVVDLTGGYYKALDFNAGAGVFSVGCAHSDGDSVVALLWNGTTWQREVVDSSTNDGAGIDFAFAPDGTPSVSYGWGKIRFAWRQADGTWKVESIEKGRANNDYTGLVYDPNTDEPTVVYRRGSNLRFARKVGGLTGEWQVETVEAAGARYQDLVYDKDGHAVIAYSDDHNDDGWLSALKIATWNGSSWDIVTLHEGATGYGVYASIAMDDAGNLLAADAGYSHIVAFRKPYGGVWGAAEEVVDGGGIHAAFHGDGTPFISYGRSGETFVAYHDGTSWQTERVAGKTGARTDIRRDPSGGLGVLHGQQGGGVGLARKE